MSGAARSIFAWGVYMVIVGLAFVLMPEMMMRTLEFTIDKEPWPVVGAGVLTVLGGYYVVAARHELVPFFRATIVGRLVLNGLFVTLVVTQRSPWQLLMLGFPDLFGALWTYLALKRLPATVAKTA